MNSISNKVSMKRKSFEDVIPFFDSECRQMHSVSYSSEETLFSRVQEIVQEGRLQNRKGNNYQPVADLRGGARDARPHLSAKISSFSCSFQEKLGK